MAVQASIAANTYVVSGHAETKSTHAARVSRATATRLTPSAPLPPLPPPPAPTSPHLPLRVGWQSFRTCFRGSSTSWDPTTSPTSRSLRRRTRWAARLRPLQKYLLAVASASERGGSLGSRVTTRVRVCVPSSFVPYRHVAFCVLTVGWRAPAHCGRRRRRGRTRPCRQLRGRRQVNLITARLLSYHGDSMPSHRPADCHRGIGVLARTAARVV